MTDWDPENSFRFFFFMREDVALLLATNRSFLTFQKAEKRRESSSRGNGLSGLLLRQQEHPIKPSDIRPDRIQRRHHRIRGRHC